MNRIYFGKTCLVEILNGKDNLGKPTWKKLDDWQRELWRHHELFQDAVNYYTLALAAMAAGLQPDSAKGKAALAWREQVRSAWIKARRKAVNFPGPHSRLAKVLEVDPQESHADKAFDLCAKALLKSSPATMEALAKALLQMLDEVDHSDLNQFCVSRLPWLCTPHGKLDATPKNVAQQQETQMLAIVREIHEAPANQLAAIAARLELGWFVARMPKEAMTGEEARVEAERLFKSASAKAKGLSAVGEQFTGLLNQLGDKLVLPRLGRKPKGAYPLAVMFKLLPSPETWDAFRSATVSLQKKALKLKNSQVEICADFIAEARTESDQPVFDYFTNRALFREPENNDRAVWFDFDLAAFIEAIKSPHRYFQDSLTRQKDAEDLRKQKLGMEGDGGGVDDRNEEGEEDAGTFGFKGDERIALLRELVSDTLGYVAEAENPGDVLGRIEYTIQERTLRGFEEVREQWRKLASKGQATEAKLLETLSEQQTKHRDDFGSATLYRELAKPKYHSIWLADGTEKWHAADPLKAWRAYKELCLELDDKERLIRFTPAHPEHSPRYFIIPKQGRFGSDHQSGQLAFTCGMVLNTVRGCEATEVRITYSAPRLQRDELRRDGKEDLESVPWLPPMIKALGLPENDSQDFANCRVTLQPKRLKPRNDSEGDRYNIQLTFPVEVNVDKLIAGIGKAERWNRQFNLHPDGEMFYNASLRWPHEKQPAKAAGAWHEKGAIFRCIATDLGQRDAGAFARLIASCTGDPGKKPSRLIGEINGQLWRAALERSGLFRLPGEDAQVWREISERDKLNPHDSGEQFDFRQELWGESGRQARAWEMNDTADLMRQLEATEQDAKGNENFMLLPEGWNKGPTELTFPEQNDKLLIGMRRYQSRIARLHRWCWFLRGDDKQQKSAWEDIGRCEDTRLVSADQRARAPKRDPRMLEELQSQLRARLKLAPKLLERISHRVLPLRGRSWHWEKHPESSERNTLHHLTQKGPPIDSEEKPIWLRGQRGLSLERIEQIEELRKRFQSLNQMLRRDIGGKPPILRDESVPDPCPDLLEKLDNLKEQRVNQTAHMILAEALGLQISPPAKNKKELRQEVDQHGAYERILDHASNWIGPVDFIIIEDLSRYRASQGRAPRENSRLMKWCHRAVRDKLKQLCEVFGLPVLETPAAYSSRFCSRSGVPGFRAQEVTAGFAYKGQWAWLSGKKDAHGEPTAEALLLQRLNATLVEAQSELERDWAERKRSGLCPKRTLLAPISSGPIFVPVAGQVHDADLQPAVAQADVNAAINLALRAIADPTLWAIYPRLRTLRDKKDGSLTAREKRKYGEKNPPKLSVAIPAKPTTESAGNPNFFADFADLKQIAKGLTVGDKSLDWLTREWTEATLASDKSTPPLLHSKSFWGTVKAAQWQRINEINGMRIAAWKNKLNPMPD